MATADHDTPLRATLAGLRDLLRPRARLQLADDERLDGRTAMITGGNRGLGFAVAEQLARRGARLILACRSGGPEAAAALRAATGNEEIEALPVDLAERASVAALVEALAEREVVLDRLVLNAAVVPLESRTTSAGLDLMFHVNFLAAVDLVEQLLARGVFRRIAETPTGPCPSGDPQGRMRAGGPPGFAKQNLGGVFRRIAETPTGPCPSGDPQGRRRAGGPPGFAKQNLGGVFRRIAETPKGPCPARIIVVSSEAHRSGQPQPLDRLGEPEHYGTSGVLARYGRNKLYLTSYAWALADALDPATIGVFTLCPGAVATDLAREAPGWMRVLLDPTMKLLFQSPQRAAEPVTWLCCARELDGQTKRYFHMHTPKPPAAWATDPRNGAALRDAARELLTKI